MNIFFLEYAVLIKKILNIDTCEVFHLTALKLHCLWNSVIILLCCCVVLYSVAYFTLVIGNNIIAPSMRAAVRWKTPLYSDYLIYLFKQKVGSFNTPYKWVKRYLNVMLLTREFIVLILFDYVQYIIIRVIQLNQIKWHNFKF